MYCNSNRENYFSKGSAFSLSPSDKTWTESCLKNPRQDVVRKPRMTTGINIMHKVLVHEHSH